MNIQLTHRPTALPGAPPEEDRTIFYGNRDIARARKVDAGPRSGQWQWSLRWAGDTDFTDSLEKALQEIKSRFSVEDLDRLPPDR